MREYLGALVGVALVGALVRMLAPEGELQKYLRLAIGLCLACTMIAPMLAALPEGNLLSWEEEWGSEEYETQNYDEIYKQSLQNGAVTQAKEAVRAKIYQEFSFSAESVGVEAVFSLKNGTTDLSEVRILLRGNGVLTDPRAIIAFVNSEWGCPCTVVYE